MSTFRIVPVVDDGGIHYKVQRRSLLVCWEDMGDCFGKAKACSLYPFRLVHRRRCSSPQHAVLWIRKHFGESACIEPWEGA
jgi:hypothetical protein